MGNATGPTQVKGSAGEPQERGEISDLGNLFVNCASLPEKFNYKMQDGFLDPWPAGH
jgi:hypothetical protein